MLDQPDMVAKRYEMGPLAVAQAVGEVARLWATSVSFNPAAALKALGQEPIDPSSMGMERIGMGTFAIAAMRLALDKPDYALSIVEMTEELGSEEEFMPSHMAEALNMSIERWGERHQK